MIAANVEITGQSAEAEPAGPRPQQAECGEREANDHKNSSHMCDMDGGSWS